MTAIDAPTTPTPASGNRLARFGRFARRNPTMLLGAAILIFFLVVAIIVSALLLSPVRKKASKRWKMEASTGAASARAATAASGWGATKIQARRPA